MDEPQAEPGQTDRTVEAEVEQRPFRLPAEAHLPALDRAEGTLDRNPNEGGAAAALILIREEPGIKRGGVLGVVDVTEINRKGGIDRVGAGTRFACAGFRAGAGGQQILRHRVRIAVEAGNLGGSERHSNAGAFDGAADLKRGAVEVERKKDPRLEFADLEALDVDQRSVVGTPEIDADTVELEFGVESQGAAGRGVADEVEEHAGVRDDVFEGGIGSRDPVLRTTLPSRHPFAELHGQLGRAVGLFIFFAVPPDHQVGHHQA